MAKKVSVVIPVYNAEKYLCQCLDSILSQPVENMEVVCVNDGSTDGSLEILKKRQEIDNRILIVNKTNSGYGDSMNKGISAASGDYISIVESDDMMVGDKLALLIDRAVQTDADVVKGNYYLFKNDNDFVLHENFQGCTYGQIINSSMEEKLFLTAPAIWSGVYRRQFLKENNICFLRTPGAAYQDTSFAFKVWACAKRVLLIDDPIIYYRQDNEDSSSNEDRKVFEIFNETAEMRAFLYRKRMEGILPMCMRVKFQSYAWTLARLSPENKTRFLLKFYYDVRSDFYEGNLMRRYWEEENWNIVYNIIFNLSRVCENVLQGYSIKESEQIYALLNKINKVYIWEEENQEDPLKRVLQENNMTIVAQINIDSEGHLVKVENGKISKVSAADRDNLIVLRVGRENEAEIIKKLHENYMCNYIEINC